MSSYPPLVALDAIDIDLRAFGITTSNSDTQNEPGFVDLQQYLHANRNRFITIKSPEGTIDVTWAGYLAGCGYVRWVGQGTTIRNTNAPAQAATMNPLFLPGPYVLDASKAAYDSDFVVNDSNEDWGYLIDGVDAGATTLTLQTASEAEGFSVGDLVLVHGLDRQPSGGAPRNPRYFEYLNLTDVDAGAGVLTLNVPLRYRYDDQWPDVDASNRIIGAPRVTRCRHPNHHWPNYIEIIGVDFGQNPGTTFGNTLSISAETLIMRGVSAKNFAGGAARYGLWANCVSERFEIDKLIETYDIEAFRQSVSDAGNQGGITAATGCQRVNLVRCHTDGALTNLIPTESLSLRQCVIPPSIDNYNLSFFVAGGHTKYLSLQENLLPATGNMTSAIVVNQSGINSITANSNTNGRDIHVTKEDINISAMDYGNTLWTVDGRGGRVEELTGDGVDIIVRLDTPDIFTPGDELQFTSVSQIVDLGGNAVVGSRRQMHQAPALLCDRNRGRERRTIEFNSTDFLWTQASLNKQNRLVRMTIEQMEVSVSTADVSTIAYTLEMRFDGLTTDNFTRVVIDVKEAGVRLIDSSGGTGVIGNDILADDVIGNFINQVYLIPRDNAATGWARSEQNEQSNFVVRFTGIVV